MHFPERMPNLLHTVFTRLSAALEQAPRLRSTFFKEHRPLMSAALIIFNISKSHIHLISFMEVKASR